MKIEKLTDNKIRIVLYIDDLAKKNIDVHSLIKNEVGTQTFFKKILKQAKKEVGFDIEDSRLLIEAFITTDGFFVLTFTKISNDSKSSKSIFPRPKVKRKSYNPSCETAIYEFNSFDEFCNFCTYINSSQIHNFKKIANNISLYEYLDKYFLVLSGIDTEYDDLPLFYTLISEFARLTSNSNSFASKLMEYGTAILKNKNDIGKCLKLL